MVRDARLTMAPDVAGTSDRVPDAPPPSTATAIHGWVGEAAAGHVAPGVDRTRWAMPAEQGPPITSSDVEPDDGVEDEGPFSAWVSPDDRLWRHPSEFRLSSEASAFSLEGFVPSRAGSVGTLERTSPLRTWTVAVVAGLVGALLASGVTMASGGLGHRTTVLQQDVTRVATPDTLALASRSTLANPDWSAVDNRIEASVVAVSNADGSAGSGVIYASGDRSRRSYILTTDDLIGGSIRVTFNDGETQVARLVGSDPKSGLALLSVPGTDRLLPTFGTVADLQVAEPLLAVSGSDQGAAPPASLTVQSVDDAVAASDDETMVGMLAVTGPATTDEGGALVDATGQVVGITTSMTALDPTQQNTSYAIPIDVARHVAAQLLAGRPATHPYLGVVNTVDLSTLIAHQLGVAGGARVETVASGSPAAAAGLSQEDVITALNGAPVGSAGALVSVVAASQPGTSMSVSYLHQGKPATVTVRITEQPASIIDPEGG
jgi:putative serine protease PepD